MRLQKAITDSGLASRREAETLIQEGHVEVNGETIYHPAMEIDPKKDLVTVDGDPLPKAQQLYYFAYHKPKGLITSRNDPQHRESVYDALPPLPVRVEAVGRLDLQTSGLLLFTNDGELANQLTHPKKNVPKKYLVKVWKTPDQRRLNLLKNGVNLDDGRTKPMKLRITDETDTQNAWIEVTVTEGRNRLIRRVFEHIGHPVSKLKRLSFATISLGKLEAGEIRMLTGEEIQRLKDIANGINPQNAGKQKKYKKGFAKPKPPKNKPLSKKRVQKHSKKPNNVQRENFSKSQNNPPRK